MNDVLIEEEYKVYKVLYIVYKEVTSCCFSNSSISQS